MVFETIIQSVGDRLFPLNCLGCDAEGSWVCGACEDALLFLLPVWQEAVPPLQGVIAVYPYDAKVVREAVHALKYLYATAVVEWMNGAINAWCAAGGADLFSSDCVIVPVPLHRRRYVERGFNQAALIAMALGAAVGRPVAPLLRRIRATNPQMAQTRAGRLLNVYNAFAVIPGSAIPRTAIIVDDVVTTGATLAACARALETAGARTVYGFAFAKEL